jgi:glycosyltransferase involved in cell wall biosynthesis
LKIKKKVFLLTNYRPDNQQSMLRFADILVRKDKENHMFDIEEISPLPFFGKISPNKRIKKWAAYLDKYLIFPKKINHKLQNLSKPVDLVHIIDHSNSVYLPQLKKISQAKKIITCHDLIAIRTAQGEFPHAPKTSRSGKRLQRWIHNSLEHADYYACDSRQTQQDLARLVPRSELNSAVIHLGTETNFPTLEKQRSSIDKFPFNPSKTNYLLHVGSAAWYKNRKAVFKAFQHACGNLPSLDLKLILVGPMPQDGELNIGLSDWFQSHPKDLICLNDICENSLCELYKHAKSLIFPSRIEGFGWPPLEAAVHGCPVITTRTGAISDLLGDYAHYIDSYVQASIDQAVILAMQSPDQRNVPISLPNHDDCRERYYDLYDQMIKN